MIFFAEVTGDVEVLGKGLMLGLGMIGPAIGIGLIGNAFMNAVGRNPFFDGQLLHHDGSSDLARRIEAFEDAALKLLSPELREQEADASIRKTRADSHFDTGKRIKIPLVGEKKVLIPLPRGTPAV